ncbi:MAG: cytochrome C oxidase Cbb3, partial [gamma proteobacterium symbiont of Bathyaustriella thionipta]|nr:cytochrome C oxidase Cbb3 [gamma proteobacterium symbiont of Bathyaustriella thionipta]
MSAFWSWWIIILTVGNIAACVWLIRWTMKKRVNEASEGDVTGHKWDGLEEFNNPLPRWWLWLFYGTIIFSVAYLALYPGLGSYKGMLDRSSFGQYDK